MSITSGTLIGRFEVRSRIGAGGMGEVYLAYDKQLRRLIALKLLSENLTRDISLLQRFEQEALTASSLNHPNILTIYEIGETSNTHFIATEFIDGVTLRERITKAPMELRQALDITLQIASALGAAHEAGIVHRDIKPENIMVRRDGFVKVLDFGLAKLTQKPEEVSSEDVTRQQVLTQAGMIMGTVQYMSPEQARGQDIDARSDIWSFGAVLYEMVAGQPPFRGSTISDIIAEVLRFEPPPLTDFSPHAPPELQRIVKKALRKDREDRYQTIKDMTVELKNLRRHLEIESEFGQSFRSAPTEKIEAVNNQAQTEMKTAMMPAVDTREVSAAPSKPDAVVQNRNRQWQPYLVAAVLLVAIGAVGFAAYKFLAVSSTANKLTVAYQTMKFTPLSKSEKAAHAAISPDGKYVAQVIDDVGQRSMWVKQIATNSDIQIIPPSNESYLRLTFSPDSNYIYYSMTRPDEGGEVYWDLYRIPTLGGPARKITDDLDTRISFSPDQKQFVFKRSIPETREMSVIKANADGSEETKLFTRYLPDYGLISAPIWSPNGKTILFASNEANETKLVELDIKSGSDKIFSEKKWQAISEAFWMPDGSGVIISAREQGSENSQIYYLSYPEAEVQRITNDTNNYGIGGLTNESNTLLAFKSSQASDIWLVESAKADDAKQITISKLQDGCCGMAWTPNNHLVFTSGATGNRDVWIMDSNGGNKKQLTSNSQNNISPMATTDGKTIVFLSDRLGTNEIWQMDIDGGNLKQLTKNVAVSKLMFLTPDNKWIVYLISRNNKNVLWKMPFDGGNPVQITQYSPHELSLSADGKTIVHKFWDEPSRKNKAVIIDFETWQIKHSFEAPQGSKDFKWMPDGKTLSYVHTLWDISNIWTIGITGESPKKLTNFQNYVITNYQWSRNGKQIAVTRRSTNKDLVLISNFKQ